MLETKTIIAISAIVVGIFLIFKDQIFSIFSNINVKTTNPIPQILPKNIPSRTDLCLLELEGLIQSLDKDKDKQDIDFLIDNLGPKLIRRRLNQ